MRVAKIKFLWLHIALRAFNELKFFNVDRDISMVKQLKIQFVVMTK